MQTGMVYQIWSPSSTDRYIGSTIQELSARMSGHRAAFKRWSADNTKEFCTSFGVLRFSDAKIELVEIVEFQSLSELKAREGHHIRAGDCLNKRIEGRTPAEYYVDNREVILKNNTMYNAAHRVENNAYYLDYYAAHRAEQAARIGVKVVCACGGKHTRGNTVSHKKTQKHLAYLAAIIPS